MKKLYKKGKVHPSPPIISVHLAFLPAAILTLTSALSPEDREVLAYLISCSGTPGNIPNGRKNTHKNSGGGGVGGAEHPPLFHCNCFQCYTSYWVRWDASPNRQLIHDIIDAFEDELSQTKKIKSKKERKKRGCNGSVDLKCFEESGGRDEMDELESVEVSGSGGGGGGDGDVVDGDSEGEDEFERGSVSRFVSFIGERIWGVWSQ